MFKSIFSKQLTAYMGMLVLVFGLLSFAATMFLRGYFIDVKADELRRQCELFGRAVENNYVTRRFMTEADDGTTSITTSGVFVLPSLQNDLRTIYYYTGVSFFFAEVKDKAVKDGGMFAYTPDIDAEAARAALAEPSVALVTQGYSESFEGSLFGAYSSNALAIGYPVVINNDVAAVVFLSASLTEIEAKAKEFVRLVVSYLLLAAAVAFVLIYITSRQISRPIKKISEAAKVIADGDFEKRLTVKSRDEIGRLAASFNEMAASLNEQETRRREFIANVSHDLRSPLTSIKGFLRAMLDGVIPPESREKYLSVIMDETERMAKLADDVMELSKSAIGVTDINAETFDMNELVCRAALALESRITDKKLEINVSLGEEPLTARADREKIARVVHNLIDNAVKFTPGGGVISLETRSENGLIRVSVKDSGPGLTEEERKRVFDRFYKADSSRGEHKTGSGLGLSIVREFVKAHGGNVGVISAEGEGCEFFFTLPL